jgi:ankyrin repeat protein
VQVYSFHCFDNAFNNK